MVVRAPAAAMETRGDCVSLLEEPPGVKYPQLYLHYTQRPERQGCSTRILSRSKGKSFLYNMNRSLQCKSMYCIVNTSWQCQRTLFLSYVGPLACLLLLELPSQAGIKTQVNGLKSFEFRSEGNSGRGKCQNGMLFPIQTSAR